MPIRPLLRRAGVPFLVATCLLAAGSSAAAQAGSPATQLARVEAELRQRSDDASLQFQRAVLLADLQRDDEALQALRELSQRFPDLPDPLNNQAVLLAARGQLHAARELLEQALRARPDHALARENLGEIYLRLALATWEAMPAAQRTARWNARLAQARQWIAAGASAQ